MTFPTLKPFALPLIAHLLGDAFFASYRLSQLKRSSTGATQVLGVALQCCVHALFAGILLTLYAEPWRGLDREGGETVQAFVPQPHGKKVIHAWRCILFSGRLDRELVKTMAKAGCTEASLGFESGSDRILNRMTKRFGGRELCLRG